MNSGKNYDLLSILEEDKRFWITNLIASISAIIGLIYYFGTLNIEIISTIYNDLPRDAGTFKIIYEIVSLPRYDFTAWIIIIFLRLFMIILLFPFSLLEILFKENNSNKENKNLGIVTLLVSLFFILRYKPNWDESYLLVLIYLLILILTTVEIVFIILIVYNKKFPKLEKFKREVEKVESEKRMILMAFSIREIMYFGFLIILLISLGLHTFEFFKIRLESFTILLLILIIYTRWIRPSYKELNIILDKINLIYTNEDYI